VAAGAIYFNKIILVTNSKEVWAAVAASCSLLLDCYSTVNVTRVCAKHSSNHTGVHVTEELDTVNAWIARHSQTQTFNSHGNNVILYFTAPLPCWDKSKLTGCHLLPVIFFNELQKPSASRPNLALSVVCKWTRYTDLKMYVFNLLRNSLLIHWDVILFYSIRK